MASRYLRSFMLCLVAFLALGAVGHAQRIAASTTGPAKGAQRITINVENAPLTAVLYTIAHQAGLTPFVIPGIIPSIKRVTLHLQEVTASDAFEQALRGTGLVANMHAGGNVAIVRNSGISLISGMITGRVTDANTHQPLRGAKIGLDGSDWRRETGENGTYRLSNVAPGTHTLLVKLIGYGRATRTVVVQDAESVAVDVALYAAANTLDQVVVTGTVVQTELKAVPNAITVITATDIEQRGITKIDQLFRGDIPGLFAQNQGSGALLDEVTMFSRGATALSTASSGTSLLPNSNTAYTNPIKTYVDGIELADPKYLSQIDPKSIERIEILAGPQASTIYGSNAINGVMQIFTKRGTTSTPQLMLNLLSGVVQNNFSSALTPQHDYSAQLSGLEGRMSYDAGGSWNYLGPWTPAKQLARTSGFGGARLDLSTTIGRITADITLRRGITRSLQRGSNNQTITAYRETGMLTNVSASGLDRPTTYTLIGQTLGVTLSYAPTAWWSHEVGFGQDASDVETRATARGYTNRGDTTLYLYQSHTDRRSIRYATTARLPLTSLAQLSIVAGTDTWQNLTSSWDVSPQTLTGSLTGTTDVSRQPGHNTGGFLQTQLGFKEKLFVTYGLRMEWNSNFGADAQPNYAPRYGAAYTQEIGELTAKLRASYGRSTRPPQPGLKVAQTIADAYGSSWSSVSPYFLPYYGVNFDVYLANVELSPEHQQGGEGGLELYFGTRGSLAITRYNQTVDGLITLLGVDSVRTLVPCLNATCAADSYDSDGYGYYRQYQYLNIGSIHNQGWELQGSVNTGPFTTKGTYSWTKSRVIGVVPKYRALVTASRYPQYQPGAIFQYLPEHTWALGLMYAKGSSSVGLNLTGTGRVMNFQDSFYFRNLDTGIRLSQNRLNVTKPPYINFNAGYASADLTASHRFAPWGEGVLQVQNVTDRYTNDYNAQYASLGRQVKAGLRLRTR